MPLPAGILKNTKTGRFHPIVFRPGSRPSAQDNDIVRHKSVGHHPAGFDTIEAARASLAERPEYKDSGLEWEWNGEETPATTCDFSLSEYGNAVQTA